MKKRWKVFIGIGVVACLVFGFSPWLIRYAESDDILAEVPEGYSMAIVFGAGVGKDGYPSDVLMDRLRAVSDLYHTGMVSKILVSGDNRFEEYNEPDAMRGYLIEVFDVKAEDVVADYAGRRTFDTCARAKEVFGIEKAVLVTQEFHLPRAMFTCEALGIENVGYSATRQSYVMDEWYESREILALYKAVVDLYIWEPEYLL